MPYQLYLKAQMESVVPYGTELTTLGLYDIVRKSRYAIPSSLQSFSRCVHATCGEFLEYRGKNDWVNRADDTHLGETPHFHTERGKEMYYTYEPNKPRSNLSHRYYGKERKDREQAINWLHCAFETIVEKDEVLTTEDMEDMITNEFGKPILTARQLGNIIANRFGYLEKVRHRNNGHTMYEYINTKGDHIGWNIVSYKDGKFTNYKYVEVIGE